MENLTPAQMYGHNVVANGRNWNAVKLLTGTPHGRRGHKLTGITFTIKDDCVLITLKKTTPKGKQVAFITANTLDDALYVMASGIKAKNLRWKADKWGSIRSDKKR
jgi:hypothetical protein